MSTNAVAVIGFISLFALMLLRVPVGMAMGLVGVSGFSYLVGGTPALKLVGQTSMRTVTDYTFGVIPMFLLMGTFVSNSGMSRELFRAANGFVGHLRGGLGIAIDQVGKAGDADEPHRHADRHAQEHQYEQRDKSQNRDRVARHRAHSTGLIWYWVPKLSG